MPRQRITLPKIASAKPMEGKKEGYTWDTDMPRLGLRTRISGAKSFIFKGTLKYKEIKITIGRVDAWNIEAAREEARRYQRWIDDGLDPREMLRHEEEARAIEKAARRDAETAARVEAERRAAPALNAWKAYVEARQHKWGVWSRRDHEKVSQEGGEPKSRGKRPGQGDKTQPGILRPLLLKPLVEIDAKAVRVWLKAEVEKRPTAAAGAFRLLRAFINWCAEQAEYQDQIHADACGASMVRDELPSPAAKKDCLQREMLRPWFQQVRSLANPVHSAYLQILLLTGARREELAALKWEDVDFRWKSLTIRDKVEGNRTIPLTPYVASLLRDLKARNETPPAEFRILQGKQIQNDLENWKPSKWVFFSKTSASGRIAEPRIGHEKVLAAAGLPDITLHGLRRSFSSLSEWLVCPDGIAAQIQGHKPSGTREKHYIRRPLDLLRLWHIKIEGWILEQADIEQPPYEISYLHAVAT